MNLRTVAAAAALALLGACSSNPPIIDYDRSADFGSYKTYAFISDRPMIRDPESPTGSPLLEGRLMQATDETLQGKGFAKVDDPESADFTIGFTVGTRDKIKVNSYPEPYRPYYGGWGWGSPYYGGVGGVYGGGTNVDVQQYTEGTLAIDIYDVAGHKPVWHGVATKRITDEMRRNPGASISEAVNEILAGFPPGL
jgi:hypothetical protein